MDSPRFLMCKPDFFGVDYVINPWMEGKTGTAVAEVAQGQWCNLQGLLTKTAGASVVEVAPQPGLPDIVFTANAACVRNGIAVPSRFRYKERQGEEPFYRTILESSGYDIIDLPEEIAFEGAGDALFYEGSVSERPLLFAAHGFRTDRNALPYLAEIFRADVIPLGLIDPSFYHLDTCFCPLPGGHLLWYPAAFDAESKARIHSAVSAEKQYTVEAFDAANFACNAVGVNNTVLLNAASDTLKATLTDWDFTVYETPLTEFMKAGGSAKCLTLRLS